MSKEIVLGIPPHPQGLGFGDVVLHPNQGRGMVYAVTGDGSLMIAFEAECVCTGYQSLRYLGSILDNMEYAHCREVETKPLTPEIIVETAKILRAGKKADRKKKRRSTRKS